MQRLLLYFFFYCYFYSLVTYYFLIVLSYSEIYKIIDVNDRCVMICLMYVKEAEIFSKLIKKIQKYLVIKQMYANVNLRVKNLNTC